MKTTFKNGDEQTTLEMAIQLQKNDRVILHNWGIKRVVKVDKNIVILGENGKT